MPEHAYRLATYIDTDVTLVDPAGDRPMPVIGRYVTVTVT
jgi:hypothetical protein